MTGTRLPAGPVGARTNWAGNVTFSASRLHRPRSIGELQQLMAAADRLRVLGTGHSFNQIADTTGGQVTLADLPPRVEIDPARRTVTVAGGLRYGELVSRLHQAGFALPSLASLPHISVAGACATGTHGSGDGLGNLATAVCGVELVTAGGELVRLRRGEPDFAAAVVGLGALGVVTSLTLDLLPAYQVQQYVFRSLPHQTLAEQFDQIFGAAYSVSVFTGWAGPAASQVWFKQRVSGGAAEAVMPRPWDGAAAAPVPAHPVPGGSPEYCTDQLGVPGPWHLRLPHFRLEFTPSSGEELQSEFFVSRDRAAEAIAAIRALADRIAPVLQISEIRTVAADEFWLSPCYRRDSVAFHFTWVADAAAVAPVVAALEQQLAPLAARPHWGKLFSLDPARLPELYPRLPDFVALAADYDPTGKLRNAFLDHYLPAT